MTLCAACGLQLYGGHALCPHHHVVSEGDRWAAGNRIMCDIIHRGIFPPRLARVEREDDFWHVTDAA